MGDVKTLSASKWTRKFINNLPDSSFAWIEPGGSKDATGKTTPRSLRHLPYKGPNGSIDLSHLRNAIARLGQGFPFGLSASRRRVLQSRLQGILRKFSTTTKIKTGVSATIFKPEEMEFTYGATIKVDTVEAKGKKKVFLDTTFVDNSINQNGWRLPKEEMENVSSQVKGNPLKIAHSKSDWDILGTGIEGRVEGNSIKSRDEVTDPEAISKFVSGTWNERNMGISPRFRFDSITCSTCGETISAAKMPIITHEHKMREVYGGEKCYYDIHGAKLIERSLTSEPAYRPSAGNIDTISLSASLQRFVYAKKMEDKNMSGTNDLKDSLEAILIEKDNRIEELAAEVSTKNKEIEELKASVEKSKEGSKKYEELEAKYKEADAKLATFVTASRKAELEKRLTDKDLIAEISKKEMTDEQFEAELKTIDKIAENTKASKKPEDKGTVAAEINPDTQKELELKIGNEMFGSNWEQSMLGVDAVSDPNKKEAK